MLSAQFSLPPRRGSLRWVGSTTGVRPEGTNRRGCARRRQDDRPIGGSAGLPGRDAHLIHCGRRGLKRGELSGHRRAEESTTAMLWLRAVCGRRCMTPHKSDEPQDRFSAEQPDRCGCSPLGVCADRPASCVKQAASHLRRRLTPSAHSHGCCSVPSRPVRVRVGW